MPARGPVLINVPRSRGANTPQGNWLQKAGGQVIKSSLQSYLMASLNNVPFDVGLNCWRRNCVRRNIFMQVPVIGLGTVFQQAMANKWFHGG